MGFRGISMGSLLLILAIVVLLFGTKKIAGLGQDLAMALKAFRQGLKDDEAAAAPSPVVTKDITDDQHHV